MLRIAVSLIALLSLLGSALAQTHPVQTATPTTPVAKRAAKEGETARSVVKPAGSKTATRRETIGKPASAGGARCDFGVVVTTGGEFTVLTTGLTIYQNKKIMVPIPSWGLSDLIFARTRAAIPAGMSVMRLPYDPAKFPLRDESKDTWKDRLFRDPKAEVAGYIREIAKGTNCRHYIQILNAISPIGSSSYTVRGFGILNQDVVLGRRVFLHALAFIRIFDGRDFAVVRQSSALITLDHSLALQRFLGKLIGGPYRELPAEAFPTRPEDAADDPALRDGVRAMLKESLDKTLPLLLGLQQATRNGNAR